MSCMFGCCMCPKSNWCLNYSTLFVMFVFMISVSSNRSSLAEHWTWRQHCSWCALFNHTKRKPTNPHICSFEYSTFKYIHYTVMYVDICSCIVKDLDLVAYILLHKKIWHVIQWYNTLWGSRAAGYSGGRRMGHANQRSTTENQFQMFTAPQ